MRSMSAGPPEAVIARAVGHGFVGQAQGCGGGKQNGGRRVTAARQDIDDHRGRMDALIEGFPAGSLDSQQAVVADAAEDLDHLPITIIAALQLAPDRGHRRGQHPVLE